MLICVRWHCTARQTVGHTALVSIRVVTSHSGVGNHLPLDAIDDDGELLQCGLICRPRLDAPRDVIELRHRIAFLRGADHRGRRQLRNGDVIGMAVRAFRTKRDDDLRSDAVQVLHDRALRRVQDRPRRVRRRETRAACISRTPSSFAAARSSASRVEPTTSGRRTLDALQKRPRSPRVAVRT